MAASGVTCPNCRVENPEKAKFCIDCGASLLRQCPACATQAPPSAKFCPECGSSLTSAESVPTPRRAIVSEVRAHAERRQLTVMFCDLVGSTQLSGLLDPEDLNDLLQLYQRTVAEEIARFDGHVAKFLGDGMLIFFGYPQAHEDDAIRAVNAGLALTKAIDELGEQVVHGRRVRLAVRVGIHTGLVVAGEMGPEGNATADIVGETPNLAARVQGEASVGEVVVTQATMRLLGTRFRVESMGARELKGVTRPVELYRVLGSLASTVEAFDRPVFGREPEIQLIKDRWAKAQQAQAQAVLLCGEPGIGKSSLAMALRKHVGKARIIEVKCSIYQQSSAFHPIIELLEHSAIFLRREDPADVRIEKIEAYLMQFGFRMDETVPLLAPLLNTPLPARYAPLALSAEGMRQKTLDLLLHIVLRRALDEPVLLVVEDAHWADPSTMQLLSMVVEKGTNARLLTLVTFRPSYQPTFGTRPNVLLLTLDRLGKSAAETLIETTAGAPLPAEIVQRILEKTDGVPLFVEELTKMVIESGHLIRLNGGFVTDGPLPEMAIPTTLHDSLMARLDHLSTVKEIAQFASVIGREFSSDLLMAVSGLDADTLKRESARLVEAELLDQFMNPEGGTSYRFRHALIQDAAYKSLLRPRRQEYHRRIAETLETQFPDTAETQPELLARHLANAGMAEPSIKYWIAAGTRALGRSANQEASIHFRRALELLPQVIDPGLQVQFEIAIQASLGVALIATLGFAAPEVEQTYSRAEALCRLVGESAALFPVRWGIWVVHLVRAEYSEAFDQAQALLRTARASGDDAQLVEALFTEGDSCFWSGKLRDARRSLSEALSVYDRERHSANALIYGQDPGVATNCYLALTLAQLGEVDEAYRHTQAAIDLAKEIGHPFSLSYALGCTLLTRLWLRDVDRVVELGDLTVSNCTEQGHAFFATSGVFMRGWGRFQSGDRTQGLADMRQGLMAFNMTGSRVAQGLFHALLGEALTEVGELAEARQIINAGLGLVGPGEEEVSAFDVHLADAHLREAEGLDPSESYTAAAEAIRRTGAVGRQSLLQVRSASSLR